MKRRQRRNEASCLFFDGKRYTYPKQNVKQRPLKDLVRWLLTRKSKKWLPFTLPDPPPLRQRVGRKELVATFINHSTLLLQLDGLNILTDPIWSKRCSPIPWLGPKRICPPGIPFDNLPPIDLVLITHNHYDHMDLPTLHRLQQYHRPLFFVPKGNATYLTRKNIDLVEELDWWEEICPLQDLRITFVPGQHFARRALFDRNKTLWGGFIIEGEGRPIYFAGDTAYGPHFQEIRKEFGAFRLACLPIGAYLPRHLMSAVHMNPAEAVQAHRDLEAAQSIPIHFGTFQLSDEDLFQPISELQAILDTEKLPLDSFVILKPGQSQFLATD